MPCTGVDSDNRVPEYLAMHVETICGTIKLYGRLCCVEHLL